MPAGLYGHKRLCCCSDRGEGEKTPTLMDYFGGVAFPKQRQLKEPLREGEEQLMSIGHFSHPTKPGDSPE